MGKKQITFLVLVLVAYCAVMVGGAHEGRIRRESEGEERSQSGKKLFILHEEKEVVKTEAGAIKVVRGISGRRFLHIGFITMEPQSLLIPQYLDSHLVVFIRQGPDYTIHLYIICPTLTFKLSFRWDFVHVTGEARIGHIYKDQLAERELKSGDIYTIEAGSAFYVVNTANGQRLHIICSIDTSESIGWHTFQVPFSPISFILYEKKLYICIYVLNI